MTHWPQVSTEVPSRFADESCSPLTSTAPSCSNSNPSAFDKGRPTSPPTTIMMGFRAQPRVGTFSMSSVRRGSRLARPLQTDLQHWPLIITEQEEVIQNLRDENTSMTRLARIALSGLVALAFILYVPCLFRSVSSVPFQSSCQSSVLLLQSVPHRSPHLIFFLFVMAPIRSRPLPPPTFPPLLTAPPARSLSHPLRRPSFPPHSPLSPRTNPVSTPATHREPHSLTARACWSARCERAVGEARRGGVGQLGGQSVWLQGSLSQVVVMPLLRKGVSCFECHLAL